MLLLSGMNLPFCEEEWIVTCETRRYPRVFSRFKDRVRVQGATHAESSHLGGSDECRRRGKSSAFHHYEEAEGLFFGLTRGGGGAEGDLFEAGRGDETDRRRATRASTYHEIERHRFVLRSCEMGCAEGEVRWSRTVKRGEKRRRKEGETSRQAFFSPSWIS